MVLISDLYGSAPEIPFEVQTLPSAANLLHVSIDTIGNESSGKTSQVLLATTADRRLHLITPDSTLALIKSNDSMHDSPILSCVFIRREPLETISTSMSGQVVLYNHKDGRVLEKRRDHKKYVIKAAAMEDLDSTWVATAGWDAKIFLYSLPKTGARSLGPPVASLSLSTDPETITFIRHPDSEYLVLLVTRKDSTLLYYYALPASKQLSDNSAELPELQLLGTQNLAPHSNTWIAFSLSAVSLCPTDPTLVAVATSSVPHMKIIIVRLIFPPLNIFSNITQEPLTQAAQKREKLIIEDKEESVIQVHVNALAPQTPYSTPQISWRPNGTGIWVNGDDGVLRGLEARSGKIVATLKGHEAGSKIRSLWAGTVKAHGLDEEWVVSGGFDKKLIVWKVKKESDLFS